MVFSQAPQDPCPSPVIKVVTEEFQDHIYCHESRLSSVVLAMTTLKGERKEIFCLNGSRKSVSTFFQLTPNYKLVVA